ncbi:MAG TPA: hypothetical protein VG759_09915 [Candidatus Angelobacter sp.]|jgi:hypothetical protein|nr:hypothetical protein [Candidatus Angelobacter sp.]
MNGRDIINVVWLVIVGIVVLCLVRVIIVALRESTGDFSARLKFLRAIDFMLKIVRPKRPSTTLASRNAKGGPPPFSHHWLAVLVAFAGLLIIATPVCWWMSKPPLWRALLTSEFNKFLTMAAHDPNRPWQPPSGRATLDQITTVVDTLSDKLRKNPYQTKEFWVLDHYWQYWNTQKLDEYLLANKMFVANGGKIHRMFLLTNEELQNPEVRNVLQEQCSIGRLASGQTGNGFELWRADPKVISGREEYEGLTRAFQQLPDTNKAFHDFDIIQFSDALYYSSDFSPDYRVMGRSILIFNPELVSKIDLRPLFKKSIAEPISCDQPLPVLRAARK